MNICIYVYLFIYSMRLSKSSRLAVISLSSFTSYTCGQAIRSVDGYACPSSSTNCCVVLNLPPSDACRRHHCQRSSESWRGRGAFVGDVATTRILRVSRDRDFSCANPSLIISHRSPGILTYVASTAAVLLRSARDG